MEGALRLLISLLQRIGALYNLEQLSPEMMSKLVPYMKKLAMGVRLASWDDRSKKETIKLIGDIDTLLDRWDLAKSNDLFEEGEREKKEEEELGMKGSERKQGNVQGTSCETDEDLEEKLKNAKDENEKRIIEKRIVEKRIMEIRNKSGDIDLERGVLKGDRI